MIIKEMKTSGTYPARAEICKEEGGLRESEHIYANFHSLRYVGHNAQVYSDPVIRPWRTYMLGKRVELGGRSSYGQQHGAKRQRRSSGRINQDSDDDEDYEDGDDECDEEVDEEQ